MFEELSIHDEPQYDEPLLGYSKSKKVEYNIPFISRRRILTSLTLIIIGVTGILTSAIVLNIPGEPREMLSSSAQSTRKLDIAPGVMFAIAIVAGFIICFAGYRFMKPALFVTGFLAGSVISYDLSRKAFKYEDWGDIATAITVIAGGLLLAFGIVLLYRLGMFLLGAAAGVIFACYLHVALLHRIDPQEPDVILYVAMGLFGVMFGLLAYRYERPIVIACTAWIGAYECIRGIGYFAGGYPMPTDLRSSFTILNPGRRIYIDDSYWWYFFATIIMCAMGILIQIRITAKDIYHAEAKRGKKKNNAEPEGQYQISDQPTQLI